MARETDGVTRRALLGAAGLVVASALGAVARRGRSLRARGSWGLRCSAASGGAAPLGTGDDRRMADEVEKGMTEHEKLLAGLEYDYTDPEIRGVPARVIRELPPLEKTEG